MATTAATEPPSLSTRKVQAASLLLVDKPAGMTSHDVVSVARRALGERRIGHHGTLDPFATGLLVLLVGRATRLAPWLDGEPKVYRATIRFGAETTTHDPEGEVAREAPPPDASAVDDAIRALTGPIQQVPPAFSAKKVGGVTSYEAARRGETLELKPVPVTVHEWVVESRSADELTARISCSGGTYIRALARDLGRLTGSAAHLTALRRLQSGPLKVEDAVSVERLREGDAPLSSPLVAMGSLARVELDETGLANVAHGRPVSVKDSDPATAGQGQADAGVTVGALLAPDGALAAVAELRDGMWMPRVVVAPAGGAPGA
jgi:tRNA pseudouridine55 synthase